LLDSVGGGALSLGGLLPKLDINVGCAEANVGGNADSFLAESVGGLLQVHLAMPEVLSNLAGSLRQVLGSNGSGVSSLPVVGGLPSYLSQAVCEGGSIDILPNLLGSGKSLLKIDIMKSDAKVAIDRSTMKAVPTATNTLVRVESALLPNLGLSSLPIVGNLL